MNNKDMLNEVIELIEQQVTIRQPCMTEIVATIDPLDDDMFKVTCSIGTKTRVETHQGPLTAILELSKMITTMFGEATNSWKEER